MPDSRQSKRGVQVVIADPFAVAVKATLGVIMGLFIFIWVALLIMDVTHRTMQAVDVRAVCAVHEGVAQVDDDNGLLLPSHLVLCRDGYVGEPKP